MAGGVRDPDDPDDDPQGREWVQIPVVWYTVVEDGNGHITIRKAKTPKEEMASDFKDMKKELIDDLWDAKKELLSKLYHIELNIQGLEVLQEADIGYLDSPDTRNLH